jgi:glycosyltransferase involved in cell wall biosynthesis
MPALNEQESVAPTLAAIFQSTRLPDEIIVADGCSSDGTVGEVLAWQGRGVDIKVVTNHAVYPGAGRNVAFQASNSEVLIAIDFGNICDPDYIEAMAAPFEADPSVGVVAGTFKPSATSDFEHCLAAIRYHDNYLIDRLSLEERRAKAPPDARHFPGMCVAFHRRAWEQASGQPSWLQTFEDVVFAQKLATQNVKIALQVHSHLHHHMRKSFAELYRMARNYARGRARAGQNDSVLLTKVAAAWGAMTAAALATPFEPWAGLMLPAIAALYFYRGGVHLLFIAERKIPSLKRILLGTQVVVARDIGTLVGFLLGWVDWMTEPKWRQKLRAYLSPLQPRTSDAE